jgi:hypothetical protein
MRQRCLQGIKAVVERQERMPAKDDDDRFVLDRQHRGLRFSRSSRQIGDRPALVPLGHGLLVDPVLLGQSPQALLTMLYRSTDRRVVVAQPWRTWPIVLPSMPRKITHHQSPESKT